MRVVVTGDFHDSLPDVPECDLLLIHGDVSRGWDYKRQLGYLNGAFRRWLKEAPATSIVGIAGNHDFVAAKDRAMMLSLPWTYLENDGAEVAGWKIWGSPWTKQFGSWAFMDEDENLTRFWRLIPDDVEILLTHDPAFGFRDEVAKGHHEGSKTLRERIDQLSCLRLFACGHIHEGYGRSEVLTPRGWFEVVNGAYGYRAELNPPIVLDIEKGDQEVRLGKAVA